MALVPCPQCNQLISEHARACPRCQREQLAACSLTLSPVPTTSATASETPAQPALTPEESFLYQCGRCWHFLRQGAWGEAARAMRLTAWLGRYVGFVLTPLGLVALLASILPVSAPAPEMGTLLLGFALGAILLLPLTLLLNRMLGPFRVRLRASSFPGGLGEGAILAVLLFVLYSVHHYFQPETKWPGSRPLTSLDTFPELPAQPVPAPAPVRSFPGKPTNPGDGASPSSRPLPAQPALIQVNFTGKGLVLNDTLVPIPCQKADLIQILGPPSRTSAKTQTVYVWDRLGVMAHEAPDTGTITAVSLAVNPSSLPYWPESVYAGSLAVDGTRLALPAGGDELRAAGFAPRRNLDFYWAKSLPTLLVGATFEGNQVRGLHLEVDRAEEAWQKLHQVFIAGNLDQIESMLEEFQAVHAGTPPGSCAELLLSATVLAGTGKPDQAEGKIIEALQLKPDSPLLHFMQGAVCQDQGKGEQAMACYDRALEATPDCWVVRMTRGRLHLAHKKYQTAAADFTETIRLLKPTERQDSLVLCHSLRGNSWFALGESQKALGDLTEAVRLAEKHQLNELLADSLWMRAGVHNWLGDKESTDRDLERVSEIRKALQSEPSPEP